jgi:hypothetical protein
MKKFVLLLVLASLNINYKSQADCTEGGFFCRETYYVCEVVFCDNSCDYYLANDCASSAIIPDACTTVHCIGFRFRGE